MTRCYSYRLLSSSLPIVTCSILAGVMETVISIDRRLTQRVQGGPKDLTPKLCVMDSYRNQGSRCRTEPYLPTIILPVGKARWVEYYLCRALVNCYSAVVTFYFMKVHLFNHRDQKYVKKKCFWYLWKVCVDVLIIYYQMFKTSGKSRKYL